MGTAVSVDEEEDEAEQPGGTQPRQKGAHCTLATLCEWYEHKTKVGDAKKLQHKTVLYVLVLQMSEAESHANEYVCCFKFKRLFLFLNLEIQYSR